MRQLLFLIFIISLFSISGCSSLGRILLSDYSKKHKEEDYEVLLGYKLEKGGRRIDEGERKKFNISFQQKISDIAPQIPAEQIIKFDLLDLTTNNYQQKNCIITPLFNFMRKKQVSYSNYRTVLGYLTEKLDHVQNNHVDIEKFLIKQIDQRIENLALIPEKVGDLVIASEIMQVKDLLRSNSYSKSSIREQLYAKIRLLNELSAIVEYIPLLKPMIRGSIVSDYGNRIDTISGKIVKHYGVDIRASYNSPVYAAAKGIVQKVKYNKGYGFYVVIEHKNNISTVYAHMSYPLKVSVGQIVEPMELIGFQGDSGNSTGDHLHYEIRHKNLPINPHIFLDIANKCDL